ncbi:DNA polymerase delta catalytic subunit, partial [Dictyocoela roeselum]
MVYFGEKNMNKVFKMAKELADKVSAHFFRPVALEFEKVYFPFLLMNKKRYAGLIYTEPDKMGRIDTKGIETVRRDNCGLVRNVINKCLHKILIERDVESAQEYVRGVIRDLYLDRIDLSQLVISKAISKSSEDYSAKQAHVALAEKMARRENQTSINLGERIAYVITKGDKKARAYEKSEDPIYVLENNIPIDIDYYIENQLSKPLFRLFDPIMDNVSDLFVGE